MSALCARGIARRARRAFLFVLVDFRFAKIKKGLPLAAASGFLFVLVDSRVGHRESKRVSPVATGDSGLCPENPQAF